MSVGSDESARLQLSDAHVGPPGYLLRSLPEGDLANTPRITISATFDPFSIGVPVVNEAGRPDRILSVIEGARRRENLGRLVAGAPGWAGSCRRLLHPTHHFCRFRPDSTSSRTARVWFGPGSRSFAFSSEKEAVQIANTAIMGPVGPSAKRAMSGEYSVGPQAAGRAPSWSMGCRSLKPGAAFRRRRSQWLRREGRRIKVSRSSLRPTTRSHRPNLKRDPLRPHPDLITELMGIDIPFPGKEGEGFFLQWLWVPGQSPAGEERCRDGPSAVPMRGAVRYSPRAHAPLR